MKKLLVFVFMLFFLVQTAAASTYINIYIDQNGMAEFLGDTNETSISGLPQGVSIQDGQIRGTTQVLTSKTGEVWTFAYSLPTNAEMKAILPEGTTIENIISPSKEEIFLERGRISIYFKSSLNVRYTVSEETGSSNQAWTLVVVIFLALGIAGYFYRKEIKKFFQPKIIYKNKKLKKDHKLEIIKQVLSSREKLILEKLKHSRKIKMSYLRKLCDIPKASFSRHVQELEKKGLVKRSGEGKNKFVEILKKI